MPRSVRPSGARARVVRTPGAGLPVAAPRSGPPPTTPHSQGGHAMLATPTLDKLHALKLPAMAQAWLEQQQNAELTALGFDERLGLLVDAEWPAPGHTPPAR